MIKLKKTVAILFLSAYLPLLGMAFADVNGDSGWYMITRFMWLVFGTWCAILLLKDK